MSRTRARASSSRRDERASALVVALAVLALFAVFAVTVGSLMRLEHQAASNHVLGVRARLLARAGFHRAMPPSFITTFIGPGILAY